MPAPVPGARRALLFDGFVALLALVPGALGCASSEPRPLDLADLSAEVAGRGATPANVAEALELAHLRALSFELPEVGADPDYDRADFWHASALAFQGEVRSARRRWAEARALAHSAGAPAAAELEVEQTGFSSSERDTWIALTFDVLGLLDAGRAEAARELGRAEARVAWSELEDAAWRAGFAVDRARAELGVSLAGAQRLADLLDSARPSVRRAELLHERGRLSDEELARLRALVAEVTHELHEEFVHVAWRRRELADAAGLPPSAAALARPTAETLEELFRKAEVPEVPGARELLERSPALRRARLAYAVAEAALRDEVARTRPGLRLGPALSLTPDDALPGGVLVLDLPHARALSGRVEAAREARERAREELEELLRAELARIEAARVEYDAARLALDEHVAPRESDTDIVWRAARARFEVDPAAVEALGMALRDRAMGILDYYDVRQEVVLSWLDLGEASGPRAVHGGENHGEVRP